MVSFFKIYRSLAHTIGLIALSFGVIALFSSNAYAHRMKVFAWVEGQVIEGEAYFSGGHVASDATVELLADQQVVATTSSNQEGQFRFEAMTPENYQIRADAGQGHVANYDIAVTEFVVDTLAVTDVQIDTDAAAGSGVAAQPAISALTSAQLEKAIAKAIRPLREQIDQYEAKVRVHDILGGMGYIFGLFGLFVLYRSRRQC